MGQWGIRGLKTRVGWECSISKELDCTVEVYMSKGRLRRESQCYKWGHSRGGAAARMRAVRVLNFERKSCEHLRWTHLEQVQHCIDLPHQVTFPAYTEQGKMGPGLG